MAASPDLVTGYWLVASDGGIFNYGDAGFEWVNGQHPPERTDRGHDGNLVREWLLAGCF